MYPVGEQSDEQTSGPVAVRESAKEDPGDSVRQVDCATDQTCTANGSAGLAPDGSTQPAANHSQLRDDSNGSEPVCAVCLGVLQALDRPCSSVSDELRTALSDSDGGGGDWHPVSSGSPATIAEHVK